MASKQSVQKLQNAIHYFQQGDSDSAETELYRLMNTQKKIPLSWFLLATIHLQKKAFSKSVDEYKKSIKLQANYPDAYNNLGVAYEALNEIECAKKSYQMAIRQNPSYASALFNLGNVYQNEKTYDKSIELYERALVQDPNYIKALNNIALVHQTLQRYDDAIGYYRKAQNLADNDADINNNLGYCYHCKEEYQSAIWQYESGLKFSPNKVEIYNNLAITFQSLEDETKAIKYFKMAISIKHDYVEALTNLANCYSRQNDILQAKELYLRALTLNPQYAEANNNYGLLLITEGKYDEAAHHFSKATSSNAKCDEANYNLSTYFLANGNFVKGWKSYHTRPTIKSTFATNAEDLNFDSLENKSVLLIKEQGIGDELFYLRFADQLSKVTHKIDAVVSQKISFLIEQVPSINNVYTEDITTLPTQYDYYLSVGDLPSIVVADNDNIPASLSLHASQDDITLVKKILQDFGPPPYIGFTWQGGQAVDKFLFKNIPIETLWEPIHKLPGTLINIQRNPTAEAMIKLNELSADRKVFDLVEFNENLRMMLALLTILDVYVGVSNTNMHLRQAVGKPAHVLVPHPPEWRWQFTGQSPWFPAFQVFRQSPDGSWNAALSELDNALKNSLRDENV